MSIRYKQAIQIGHNITDNMQVPCVMECTKRDNLRGGHRIEYYYTLDPSKMVPREWQYAHLGDWLCEDYDGRWHLLTDEEYQETIKNETNL